MAKKKKDEQPVEPAPAPERKEPPKLPKERNPLLTVLTILLVLVGVGELALWGYFGFSTFRANRALRQYEAEQQAAAEERASRGLTAGSSYSARLKVENGQVTWRREDDLSAGGGTTSGSAMSQNGGGAQADQSQSRISIPNIPYALAKPEPEESPAVQPTEPAATPA